VVVREGLKRAAGPLQTLSHHHTIPLCRSAAGAEACELYDLLSGNSVQNFCDASLNIPFLIALPPAWRLHIINLFDISLYSFLPSLFTLDLLHK